MPTGASIPKKGGVAHGNTEQAKAMAADFSKLMSEAGDTRFAGRKKSAIDLTGENFLTYCQVSGNKVAFLVQVPEFKQYKDEVRDALISVAWLMANRVVKEAGLTHVERIGVGLRGVLLYGGLAIGPPDEAPEKTDAGVTVEDELLYAFFAEPALAEESHADGPAADEPAADDSNGDEPQESE
jgi:hypothetical protein